MPGGYPQSPKMIGNPSGKAVIRAVLKEFRRAADLLAAAGKNLVFFGEITQRLKKWP